MTHQAMARAPNPACCARIDSERLDVSAAFFWKSLVLATEKSVYHQMDMPCRMGCSRTANQNLLIGAILHCTHILYIVQPSILKCVREYPNICLRDHFIVYACIDYSYVPNCAIGS